MITSTGSVQTSARRPQRRPETFEEAIVRLAREAAAADIRIHYHGNTWYATSQRDELLLHRVTLYSCDCPGFQRHQRCRHLAHLLDVTGNLLTLPHPPHTPAMDAGPTRCPTCNGIGETPSTRGTGRGRYVYDWQTCRGCHGTGRRIPVAA
jgi:hypothetical protein